MAELTFRELKDRVGQKLAIIAGNEELSAEDDAIIGNACTSVQAQALLLNIADLAVESGIDEAYADAFADLAAAECADAFDLPEPKRSIIGANKVGLPGRSPAEIRFRALFISTKQYTRPDVTYV